MHKFPVAMLTLAMTLSAGPGVAQSLDTGGTSTLPSTGGTSTMSGGDTDFGSPSGFSDDGIESRATRGSSDIDSVEADSLARSDDIGTSADTTFGASSDLPELRASDVEDLNIAPPRLESMATPRVGIDLGAIRRGLSAAPSGTPDAHGN
ncbi:hypothetical protein [Jiella marina]|uniref:hypothetical protein n=1 Tax=Jiella sp. LLJ827 TaxID=2917712 RepID=UPI002101AFDF|nr:hypothetical protein [Jiella sp. LLJ827]MCQ0988257.1 hypothetical protein [Jiella sp. LLJ827]